MDIKRLARIMKALSHPNRLEIFMTLLHEHEAQFENDAKCGCDCLISEIAQKLSIGAPTISHHLKELTDTGLITTDRQGKFLVARINEETVQAMKAAFAHVPAQPA